MKYICFWQERLEEHPHCYLSGFICLSADAAEQSVGQLLDEAVCPPLSQWLCEAGARQKLQHRKNQDWTQPGRKLSLLMD